MAPAAPSTAPTPTTPPPDIGDVIETQDFPTWQEILEALNLPPWLESLPDLGQRLVGPVLALLALVISGLFYLWFTTFLRTRRARALPKDDRRWGIQPDTQGIPDAKLNLYRHLILKSETGIQNADDYHWLRLVHDVWQLGLLFVLCLLGAALSLATGGQAFGLVLFLLPLPFIGVAIWFRSLQWSRSAIIETNENLCLYTVYPAWMTWKQPVVLRFTLYKLSVVNPAYSKLGRHLKPESHTLKCGTDMTEEDEHIRHIQFVKNVDRHVEVLKPYTEEDQPIAGQDNMIKKNEEVVEAVRENTARMGELIDLIQKGSAGSHTTSQD